MSKALDALELALPIMIETATSFFSDLCIPKEIGEGEYEPRLETFDFAFAGDAVALLEAIRAAEDALGRQSDCMKPWLRQLIAHGEALLGVEVIA